MAKKRPGKNQMGRPSHIPTQKNRETVCDLIIHGFDHDSIAAELGISDETLRKHYKHELKTARIAKVSKVAAKAYELAEAGNEAMIKLVLERMGGRDWSPSAKQIEISGPNGSPIAVQRFDYDAIPIEQKRYITQVLDAVVVSEEKDGE